MVRTILIYYLFLMVNEIELLYLINFHKFFPRLQFLNIRILPDKYFSPHPIAGHEGKIKTDVYYVIPM